MGTLYPGRVHLTGRHVRDRKLETLYLANMLRSYRGCGRRKNLEIGHD